MKLKKLLGIGALSLLGSCGSVKEKLPEYPKMTFEQKLQYHTQDNYLNYEEAKDLSNCYEAESKNPSDQGIRINITDKKLFLDNKLNRDFPGITSDRNYKIS
ncbi:hypothetical protein HY837_03300 [archaeon]|nr:hypothetical protein [archaeon]